ncbi:MAG: hypothetical protein LAT58_12425 [Opitutales bacterium]|nr:hypothetical protein [Opitutales bacterium]
MKFLFLFIGVCFVGLNFSSTSHARVGEGRNAIENRILQREIGAKLEGERAANQRQRAPYHRYLSLPREDGRSFYEMGELVVYYKTDEPSDERVRLPSGNRFSEGWTLHVFYVGNRSVLEYYNRHGQDLSEFERNAILSLHRESSGWRELEEEDEPEQSAFGYNFERKDGALRARVGSSGMMIFTSSLDRSVYERRKAEREFRRSEERQAAPASVHGF